MNSLFAKSLTELIYKRLAIFLQSNPGWIKKYPYLGEDKDVWANKHYVALADVIGTSDSFVKRLFGYAGHVPPQAINVRTKEKLLVYFELAEWSILEQAIIDQSQTGLRGQHPSTINVQLKEIEKQIRMIRDQL